MPNIFGGGKSTTKVEGRNLTGQEMELIGQQVELAKQQLAAVKSAMASSEQGASSTAGLLERSLEIFEGAISDDTIAEQQALIKESADRAIETGSVDIERFRSQSIDDLLGRIAPSRGLRPSDSPIVDRGGDIIAEATRQTGQLVSGVRGQQADFERMLRERAFENRLRIGGVLGDIGLQQQSFGLSLATGIPANIGGTLAAIGASQPQTSSSRAPQEFATGVANVGALAGGAGGLLSGLALVSSIKFKGQMGALDIKDLLAKVKLLRCEKWHWLDDREPRASHCGPYAEDMRDLFGVGDGTSYTVYDALGVLFGMVKALDERVESYGQ